MRYYFVSAIIATPQGPAFANYTTHTAGEFNPADFIGREMVANGNLPLTVLAFTECTRRAHEDWQEFRKVMRLRQEQAAAKPAEDHQPDAPAAEPAS